MLTRRAVPGFRGHVVSGTLGLAGGAAAEKAQERR
jgi:hypothetical protein